MNIALFGATGMVGQRMAQEALRRDHHVTGIVRNPTPSPISHERFHLIRGNVHDPASVAEVVAGHDVVISAIAPGATDQESPSHAARSLLAGLKRVRVRRLLVVGGAGSLEVAPGVLLMQTPAFPHEWKAVALAHREALDVYRAEHELEWSYLSPPAFLAPGERTGHSRIGTDQLLTDDQGESRISAEDYAIALLDEIDHSRFVRQRFTVAY